MEHLNTHTGHNTDHIHFTAVGKEIGENGISPVKIEFRITIDEIKISKKN
jgi:hypothetical protein